MPSQSPLARRTRERFESQVRVLHKQLDEMKDELTRTLKTVIDLAPAEAQAILWEYRSPSSKEELDAWRYRIADAVLEIAQPKPALEMREWCSTTERTFCPLCRGSRIDWIGPRDRGFAYPDGLKRHLLGRYNSKRCLVVDAVLRYAQLSLERATANLDLLTPDLSSQSG